MWAAPLPPHMTALSARMRPELGCASNILESPPDRMLGWRCWLGVARFPCPSQERLVPSVQATRCIGMPCLFLVLWMRPNFDLDTLACEPLMVRTCYMR